MFYLEFKLNWVSCIFICCIYFQVLFAMQSRGLKPWSEDLIWFMQCGAVWPAVRSVGCCATAGQVGVE